MSAYRDKAPHAERLLVCCGVCPRKCHFNIGVCWWNEVHPAGISEDHLDGTGVLLNDGTSQEWITVEQMRDKRAGRTKDEEDDEA